MGNILLFVNGKCIREFQFNCLLTYQTLGHKDSETVPGVLCDNSRVHLGPDVSFKKLCNQAQKQDGKDESHENHEPYLSFEN